MRVAADDGDESVLAVGILHGADDVRRASAGREPDQHIAAAKINILQIHRPLRFVVFNVLYGAQNRFMAARDDAHHLFGASAEGRRTLAGVKDPQTI